MPLTPNDVFGLFMFNGVTVDCAGNVYAAGALSGGSVRVGDIVVAEPTDNNRAVIAAFTASGHVVGVQVVAPNTDPASSAYGASIAATCQGMVYAAGQFTGRVMADRPLAAGNYSDAELLVLGLSSNLAGGLAGVSPMTAKTGDLVSPVFDATTTGPVFADLVPGFDYLADSAQNGPMSACVCRQLAHPAARRLGTACSSSSMLLSTSG